MSNYRQTYRFFHNHTHHQQRRSYNPRNAPRRANYQSSRRQHQNVHNNPHANYSTFECNGTYTATHHHEYFAPQLQDQNNRSPYGLISSSPLPYNGQVDEVSVATVLMQTTTNGNIFDYIRYLTNLEGNSRFNLSRNEYVAYLLENNDDVLKYLKTRTHHAPTKDGVDPEVESKICSICISEFKHEEKKKALQCGHEYHTDCIYQWLAKKKDCPMCRASVLPS
ncbi:RING-H2 finger protein ATL8-like [Capsicum galapagoense]